MTSALLDLDVLLSVMVTGNGDVPLAFIEDPAARNAPGPGEPANLLITTVLRLGLHLVTDLDAFTTPLAMDWHRRSLPSRRDGIRDCGTCRNRPGSVFGVPTIGQNLDGDELSLGGRGLSIVAGLSLTVGVHGSPALRHTVWSDLDLTVN